jgi:methionine synthase II (cobalamin-independent)
MTTCFPANCLSLQIGSLPGKDHNLAREWIFKYSPEIPTWAQLTAFRREGMVAQFLHGMPGLQENEDGVFIERSGEAFEKEILAFYEEYMAVCDGKVDTSYSRLALRTDTARGFFTLIEGLKKRSELPVAVKGQITGPFTFTTGVKDSEGRAILYDDQLKDAALKLLSMKAAWQVRQLSTFDRPVIIFIDEPALAGFGSSEFIGVSREEVQNDLAAVINAIHDQGGLAGIHVCANTDWSLILNTSVDIVNFDAYSYFDRFLLYPDYIVRFVESGRILAWGIIPTASPEIIRKESAASLIVRWEDQIRAITALGLDMVKIKSQSLITPSCGVGTQALELAEKVLRLTQEVSAELRNEG